MLSQEKVLFGLKNAIHGVIYDIEQYKLGRVLTIIDASTSDVEQRKAMKDVIKDAFYSKEYHSDRLGEIIYQACARLGINPFKTSGSQKEFLGHSINEVPTEDYFPEALYQEEPGVAESK